MVSLDAGSILGGGGRFAQETSETASAPLPKAAFLARPHCRNIPSKAIRLYTFLMFRESLREVVEGVDGGLASTVMDFEGIPLDSFSLDGAQFDIEAVGVEASVLVKSIQRATSVLEAGDTKEVSIRSDKVVTLIRVVNDTYFVTLTLEPSGNLGKARYLLRLLAPKLAQELD